jgi:WD40 repeat protein
MQFNAFPSDSSVNEILFYGDILLASGSDGIRKWNINKGDELEQLEIFFVWDFDVLPSHILATSGYVDKVANTPNILQLWNINSNELLTTLYDDEGVYITDIAFNRQGTILALGGGSGKIDLWGITEECT